MEAKEEEEGLRTIQWLGPWRLMHESAHVISGTPDGNDLPQSKAGRWGSALGLGLGIPARHGGARGEKAGRTVGPGKQPHVDKWQGRKMNRQRMGNRKEKQHNAASQGWRNLSFMEEKTVKKNKDRQKATEFGPQQFGKTISV